MEDKSNEDKLECTTINNNSREDENTSSENEKGDIKVSEFDNCDNGTDKENNMKMLVVRAKHKSYKQRFIRRLMLYGLKPNIRVAPLRNIFCKKKISVVNIRKRIEGMYLYPYHSAGSR